MLDPFFWGKILIGSNDGNVVTNKKYEKKRKYKRYRIWIGSKGGNVVTNEKSKKRKNVKNI